MTDQATDAGAGAPRCTHCGAALGGGAAEGLCLRCLLAGALDPGIGDEPTELESPASLLRRKDFAGYELLGEIARGGMGIVFRARQRRPDRVVALKVIAAGELASPRTIERFRAETEAAARLDHPNIASIYEVGVEGGWHYFSMRLIEGGTLADRLLDGPMPPRTAAELFVLVARAVNHAHQRGILHRDIKPTNILVDADGAPHLTDFGLAKIIESDSSLTISNTILGTPAYMPPEQALGNTRDLTMAADVYSLGAVFYEMLAGKPPFWAANARALLRRILDDEPAPPSRIRPSVHGRLNRELDVICLKCLEKLPARRYPSAADLADEVERWLRGEPIHAQPSTGAERFIKWARRNRGVVAAAATILVILVAGIAVSATQAVRAQRAEASQELLRQNAEAQAYGADINLAQQTLNANNIGRARDLLDRYRPAPGGEDRRDWEWRFLWRQAQSDADATLLQLTHSVASLSISADGGLIAVGEGGGGHLTVRKVGDGSEVFSTPPSALDIACAFSPRAPLLAFGFTTETAAAARRYSVRVWNAATGRVTGEVSVNGEVSHLQFSSDGLRLLAVTAQPSAGARVWRVSDLAQVADYSIESRWIAGSDATADLDRLVCGGDGGILRMIDMSSGTALWQTRAADEIVHAVAFSADGRIVATGGAFAESAIRLWDSASGALIATLEGHSGYIESLVFTRDGRHLTSASSDQTIRVWDLESKKPVGVLRGHLQEVWRLAFLPGEQTLVSGCKDGSVFLWDWKKAGRPRDHVTIPAPAVAESFKPDSKTVILAGRDGRVTEWSGPGFSSNRTILDVGHPVIHGCFDRNPRRLAVQLPSHAIEVWDLSARRPLGRFSLTNAAAQPANFRNDGSRLLFDNYEGPDLFEWNVDAGTLSQHWRGPADGGQVGGVLFDTGKCRLIVSPPGRAQIRRLDAQTSEDFTLDINEADAATFSPDDRFLAVTSLLSYVRIWEWPSRKVAGTLRGFLQGVHGVAFSANGRRVAASGSGHEALKLYDFATDRELITLEGAGSIFEAIAFSPDGSSIMARNSSGVVHVWSAPSFAEITATEKAPAQTVKAKTPGDVPVSPGVP